MAGPISPLREPSPFLIDETFFHEFHSGLIWIQTIFANVNRERKKERERHPFGKSKCIDRLTSRAREMYVIVLFEFRHFFNSENSSTYFKVSCRSLQKILIVRDVLECKLEVKLGICANESKQKRFGFLKEERKCSDSSVVRG